MRKPTLHVAPYRHSLTTPWCIEGYRTHDGKRKRLFFGTEKEANAELDKLKTQMQNEGRAGLLISDRLRVEAVACSERLKPFGKSLTAAVDHLAFIPPSLGT
jgi:hypothetical protein